MFHAPNLLGFIVVVLILALGWMFLFGGKR